MKFENSNFTGGRVLLDGNEFVRCTFEGTTLLYSGQSPTTLIECNFSNTQWTFDGAAALTLNLVGSLYKGGDEGKAFVESLFKQANTVARPSLGVADVTNANVAIPTK